MSKQIFITLFSLILSFVTCPMAHNIYSDPVLSKTSGKFDAFLIDFKGIKTPYSTYWSLCNFGLDLTDFKKTHPDATGGGAYGGLQTLINSRVAILSFWEIQYTENGVSKVQRANRVYPDGAESTFGGEGEGTNCIKPYEWETNNWYRYLLKSWQDVKTGNTFVGQWILDVASGKWTLFAYFNTNLKNSYLRGGMSMFQENFNEKYNGSERKFNLKNTYVHDIDKDDWISLPTTKLSYDPPSWGFNTAGTHEFGGTDEYFWGSTGLPVTDQKEYDANNPSSLVVTITQPEMPQIFGGIKITNYSVKAEKDRAVFSWEISDFDFPMLSYTVTIKDSSGEVVHSYLSTRPEERLYSYSGKFSGKYVYTLEVTSVFGETASKSLTYTV